MAWLSPKSSARSVKFAGGFSAQGAANQSSPLRGSHKGWTVQVWKGNVKCVQRRSTALPWRNQVIGEFRAAPKLAGSFNAVQRFLHTRMPFKGQPARLFGNMDHHGQECHKMTYNPANGCCSRLLFTAAVQDCCSGVNIRCSPSIARPLSRCQSLFSRSKH